MRSAAAGIAIGIAFLAGFAWAALRPPETGDASAPGGPDPVRPLLADERLLDASPGKSYDAVYRVRLPKTAAPGEPPLRLYCDVAGEENYLALDLYPDRTCLGISEAGLFAELASFPPVAGESVSDIETLRLRRRWPGLELVADGRRIFRTVVEGFPDGRIGIGTRTKTAEATLPAVQPVTPIVFLDEFMRQPDGTGPWRAAGGARWRIRGADNPARSSNAFVFEGVGPDRGAVLVGRPDWTDYRFDVSALAPERGALGIVLSAEPPAEADALPPRACILRWTTGTDGDGQPPTMRILERNGGSERVLAETDGGLRPGQWYRLGGRLLDGRVSMSVDGHEVLTAGSPAFSGGSAGLWVEGELPAEFDDVEIRSVRETAAPEAEGRWLFVGPGWGASAGDLRAEAQLGLRTFAIQGRPGWRDVTLSARGDAGADPVGLVAAWRDPGNYLACLLDSANDVLRLIRVEQGVTRILAEGRASEQVEGGRIRLSLDRGVLRSGHLSAFVPKVDPGRVGVFTGPGQGGEWARALATVEDFRAESLSPQTGEEVNEIFGEELLMAAWSGGEGDWRQSAPPEGFERAWWHRSLLYGDVGIEAELPEELPEGWTLALSVGKPELAETANNGYVLLTAASPVGGAIVLNRQGVTVARAPVGAGESLRRIRLRRAGPFLLVYVDDRLRFHWKDPDPLRGPMAAWAERGLGLSPEAVRIMNRNQVSEFFTSAPSAWRQAGGVWQITNRWECDPRWSFMSGMPPRIVRKRIGTTPSRDPGEVWLRESMTERLERLPATDSEVAALWNKRIYRGGISVDAFVGPLHLRSDGNYLRTAKNFCMTIGGDGRDLGTGYAFVLAGWDNTRSAIFRNGELVAEQEGGIPQVQGIHRRWLHIQASCRDGLVEFIGSVQLTPHAREEPFVRLAYSDPDPIESGQVAVWSYDSGMVVARMRISAEEIGPYEDPFASYPAVSPCLFAPRPEVVSR